MCATACATMIKDIRDKFLMLFDPFRRSAFQNKIDAFVHIQLLALKECFHSALLKLVRNGDKTSILVWNE